MTSDPRGNVAVIQAPNRLMAEMWAELLRSNGIACRIVPLNTGGSVYAPALEDFGVVVSTADAERARELLPVD
ncbi:MAG TPA: DUF2007 domain-containing protein [Chloroflexota bacterium]|nr:DUF2007 domain-containing protein [Chloroflexota bacterium]